MGFREMFRSVRGHGKVERKTTTTPPVRQSQWKMDRHNWSETETEMCLHYILRVPESVFSSFRLCVQYSAWHGSSSSRNGTKASSEHVPFVQFHCTRPQENSIDNVVNSWRISFVRFGRQSMQKQKPTTTWEEHSTQKWRKFTLRR